MAPAAATSAGQGSHWLVSQARTQTQTQTQNPMLSAGVCHSAATRRTKMIYDNAAMAEGRRERGSREDSAGGRGNCDWVDRCPDRVAFVA